MLVAAAILPHPPLLIPEVSVSAPDWLTDLRAIVAESVRALVAREPDAVVAVAAGDHAAEWDESAGGSMAGFGVDVRAGGGRLVLPAPLTIAARLLDDAGWSGARTYAVVPAGADAETRASLGRRLAASRPRVALLAMGDGSAKRNREAPGYLDGRAEAFDREAVDALAAADTGRLLALDAALAAQMWVAGLAAWQALAGALDAEAPVDARVRYDDAPRGVGYFVVDWSVSEAGR
jgi:hypothetical protein